MQPSFFWFLFFALSLSACGSKSSKKTTTQLVKSIESILLTSTQTSTETQISANSSTATVTASVTNSNSTITVTSSATTTQASSTTTTVTVTHPIGGTISGLVGTVILQNNSGDNLLLDTNGAFIFATSIAQGDSYSVSVYEQPTQQVCTASRNTGTVTAAVTTVSITCSTNAYTVGGSLTGVTGTITLQNNGTDTLSLTAIQTPFTFPNEVAYGAPYSVVVTTPPTTQTCSAANGTGTMGAGNVTNVAVSCLTIPSITFSDITKYWTFLQTITQTFAATSNSPGAFTYSISSNTLASISNGTCTMSNIGTATITATEAASGQYASATKTALVIVGVNYCASQPCLHEGTCTNLSNNYSCSCVSPYSGAICELSDTTCSGGGYCLNGGTCNADAVGGSCSCTACFAGDRCDQPILTDECA
jgi:hypothetical protein